MLINEQEAVELTLAQAGHALCHRVRSVRAIPLVRHRMRPLQFIQCNPHPAQMRYSRAESFRLLFHLMKFSQFLAKSIQFSILTIVKFIDRATDRN